MRQNIENSISESRPNFFEFVQKCNDAFREISPSIYLYRKIIEKHKVDVPYLELLKDDEFLELVYVTLIAWNMNQRRAKLVSFDEFKDSIVKNKLSLHELHTCHLSHLSDDDLPSILDKLEKLFSGMHVMQSKSRIVGVSKTLHFLLPNLVMPIDRTYTLNFFYGYDKCGQDVSDEFKTFKDVFEKVLKIAKKLNLSEKDIEKLDDGRNWNTSVPKLVDNAIIGYKTK